MSNNTVLLTGTERDEYIAKHFTSDTIVSDDLMIESPYSPKEQDDFGVWYDGKSEDMQELIDSISDRTHHIIEESEYDEFISELEDEGITSATEFEDRFGAEFVFESELLDWVESLIQDCGYLNDVPAFISSHIDYQAVWQCELRYDYSTIEFNGKTYLFSNC